MLLTDTTKVNKFKIFKTNKFCAKLIFSSNETQQGYFNNKYYINKVELQGVSKKTKP